MRSIHMRKLVALTLALLLIATTANARLRRGSVSGTPTNVLHVREIA